ncbi:MAG: GntR family transcriptional regulator [Spirochaetes bacterium]|nr:GntR family transcriptional regulator [Spirochaetota bacterium]
MKIATEGRRSYTRQLTDILVTRIVAEAEGNGGRVPSFRELARRFSTSINTVHYAVRRLVKDGILTSRAGKGTFLATRHKARVLGLTRRTRISIALLVSDSMGNHAWLNPHLEALTAYQNRHPEMSFSVHYFRGFDIFSDANASIADFITKGFVQGVIIISPVYAHNIHRFIRDDIPVVPMYNNYPYRIDNVQTDYTPLYQEMLRVMTETKRTRMLLVTGKDRNTKQNRFVAGFDAFRKNSGASFSADALYFQRDGRDAIKAFISAQRDVFAQAEVIVTTGDEAAMACRSLLNEIRSSALIISHYDYVSTIGDYNIEKTSRAEMTHALTLIMTRIAQPDVHKEHA